MLKTYTYTKLSVVINNKLYLLFGIKMNIDMWSRHVIAPSQAIKSLILCIKKFNDWINQHQNSKITKKIYLEVTKNALDYPSEFLDITFYTETTTKYLHYSSIKKANLTWLFLWKHIWKPRIQNEVDMQSTTHFTVFKTVKCMMLH